MSDWILIPLIIVFISFVDRIFNGSITNWIRTLFPNYELYRRLELVKVNTLIRIEWDQIYGGIGSVTVLSNDPVKRKIVVQAYWSNYIEAQSNQKQMLVLRYSDKHLENFIILNDDIHVSERLNKPITVSSVIELFTESDLQERLTEALESEDYERARQLQDQINKLSKK